MLPKPILGSASGANTQNKSAKDNKKDGAQVESGLAQFAALPTTAETLIQSRTPLDTIQGTISHHQTAEFAEQPADLPVALTREQSAALFQTLAAGGGATRSDSALPTGVPADEASAESVLLNRLVEAIEDARGGSAQSETHLIGVMREVVLDLRARGINPPISATADGRIYLETRLEK